MKLGRILAVGCCGIAMTACGSAKQAVVISDRGIGRVGLGLARATAIHDLTAIFGRGAAVDSSRDGCSPQQTEVGWKHLYADFTRGRLSGYRYMEDGWPFGGHSPPSDLPRLVTTRRITLGSTLAQARAAYHGLKAVGTNRWETPDGLVLWDNASRYPDPPSSRIVEISLSKCGDF